MDPDIIHTLINDNAARLKNPMARTTDEVSNSVSRLHSQTISQRLGTALNIDVKTVGAKPILRDYFHFCMFVL